MHLAIAGEQPDGPSASAAASEASTAADALEQTAETPVEGELAALCCSVFLLQAVPVQSSDSETVDTICFRVLCCFHQYIAKCYSHEVVFRSA